ncbi:hypothetical protein F2Q69_00047567 [Brassica cretica]|uniref:Uncharacterized protein n=1 Tax=Brassica cretica TaxID=69181 RepID=A0A8S9PIK6_BRACR|nr:hypothetical protein F2Q69_00047567 [Brassica cretica]
MNYFTFSGCDASHHHRKKTHLRALVLLCILLMSILALLFFLRFWLMGAASPWVGTEFSLLRCCLPRRCSMMVWFSDFVPSSLPSLLSHLVAAFITARVSGGSPFRHCLPSILASSDCFSSFPPSLGIGQTVITFMGSNPFWERRWASRPVWILADRS